MKVRIPNEETRQEFVRTLRRGTNRVIVQMVRDAGRLLQDTLDMDAQAVAAAVEKAHDSRLGPRWYNDEQALRFAVKLAYLRRSTSSPRSRGFPRDAASPTSSTCPSATAACRPW